MTEPQIDSRRRFAMIPEDLLSDRTLPDSAVRVFGALNRFGSTPDRCYPSVARIAEMAGTNASAVKKALNALEEAGWIRRFARAAKGGLKTSNGYQLFQVPMGRNRTNEPQSPCSADGSEQNHRWVGSDPADGSDPTSTDGSDPTHEREPDQPELLNERTGTQTTHAWRDRPSGLRSLSDLAAADAGFERFVAAFPRQVDLTAGWDAWKWAIGRADPERIIAAAGEYAQWVARTNEREQFVDPPAKWLRRQGWTDANTLNLPEDPWWQHVEQYGARTASMEELGIVIGTDGLMRSRSEAEALGVLPPDLKAASGLDTP